MKFTNHRRLRMSTGEAITALAVANGATVYTETIAVDRNVGFVAVLAKEDKTGGAGDIGLNAEYSVDGTNFYTNYTTSSGTLTAEAAVVTSLQNVTRLIQHTARLARFMRYKITGAAASQLTLDLIYQEDE